MADHGNIPKRWLALFKLLPGYDPVATAGPGHWFDVKTADNAVEFFARFLTHIEGEKAGQPFELEDWQKAQVGCAFGWKRKDGTRRYREVFDYEPRKNGKSTKLGGLVNLVAFCDGEPGAQIYSAAAEREQAALVYRQAKGMILNKPELESKVKMYSTFKSIEYPNGVIYKALSADANTKHGFNSHFVVVDELHAHPSRDLVDVLLTSTGARRQPLVWYITTADFERESICNEKYDYARKVRDGVFSDPSFLPVIFEASPEDDWTKESTWRKANPSLGVSVSLDYLERECRRAQETPTYENTFKRLHLNLRTQQDVRWLPIETWRRSAVGITDALAWREQMLAKLRGRKCHAAFDLSSTQDITALGLLFPDEDGPVFLPWFFAPEQNAAKRERKDRVPYQTWARQGWMELTPGEVVDYDRLREQLKTLADQYEIMDVAGDPWNATHLMTQLQGDSFNVVQFRQGYASMSAPTKELEKLAVAGKFQHGNNPILSWMASNVAAEQDAAGNVKLSKAKSTERIDGMVVAVMCIGRMMVTDDTQGTSIYERQGLVVL